MPIYDRGYRKHEGRSPLQRLRFWPITREGLRLVIERRALLALFGLSLLPFVVRAVQLYVVTRFPEAARIAPVDGRLFGEFLNQQIVFALLLSVFGGAGLVAQDLGSGAILVYLSRPLTRRDYVLGKLGVVGGLNLGVTLVPALLLYGLGLSLTPDTFFRADRAWIGPAIVAQSLILSTTLGLLALAVSSMARSARAGGLAFFGLVASLEVARRVLALLQGRPEVHLLSIQQDLRMVGGMLFGLSRGGPDLHPAYPWLALLATCGLCLLVLRARIRAVNVVG
ncbi:MAG TPA: ABC transporter permease subunit [Vicinamibacteria bacterium]